MMNPVLLIAVPLLFAFSSLMMKKMQNLLLILGSMINLMLIFFLDQGQYLIGGFKPPYGINLVLDDYSVIACILVNGLFLLITMMSFEKIGKYGTVLLVALAGMNGMLLTGDLFNLFVFLEITSITAYILASASKKVQHAFNYLVLGTVGSGFLLFGIVILYAVFGSLNMADISVKMAQVKLSQLILPTFLIFTGLAVEAKILPFNGWVRGVYGNTNSLTGALFASVYAGTMLFVFGRVFGQVIVMSGYLKTVIIIIGMVTLLAGETAALSKTRIREILLYSSIGQSGLIVTLFVSGLIFPAVMQLINNVLTKAIMFTIGGRVSDTTGTDEKQELQGIFMKNQVIGVCFTVAALSLIGLPLFFGFFSKINLLLGVFSLSNFWIPVVVLLATVIEGAYFIRLLVKLWTPGEEGVVSSEEAASDYGIKFESIQLIGLVVITLSLIISGLLPGLVQNNLSPSGELLNEETPSYLFDMKGGF
jgi:multicomponent Na+:H+ antiporter subunit D